ncbi:prolipoprotein diacylglyceryl transferase [Roseicitreum antarcticum]|uniref:Phosphatidylglycerol--prolipoprotein diacylglyceryl transferase n=1 Tax=Roseicitreum antarcticum TaxID=564137 RepID=A0A1H2S405_9RHOB|nr:prolipoprotein diacylglyceryl transferase [Roseicitreum antarcticum]SDW26258.1 phosphatidylglycerol:prolipoprotein diacylglycerol transferase [Roseicitreum antarcticum]
MTLAAIPFPDIAPEIFSIDLGAFTFALRWYALAYVAGLLLGWWAVVRLMRRPTLWPRDTAPMAPALVESLLTHVILGVILGGRLGFVLFYQPQYYATYPAEILRIWEGGMSFHGGFLGVVVAGLLFCRRNAVPPMRLGDAMAMVAPIGIGLGRLSNFINAELWGRATTAPWGVIFPGAAAQDCAPALHDAATGLCARHPTQLYEAALEGLLLGAVLFWLVWRRGWLKRPGQITGLFIAGYGAARFTVEIWRQADAQFITAMNPMGYVVQVGPLGLSMGQVLSLPMIAVGLALLWQARRRTPAQV